MPSPSIRCPSSIFCWCIVSLRSSLRSASLVPLAWHVLQLHFIGDVFWSAHEECSAVVTAF
uniref:Uncharacterized protein n=1 Tax=Arundo donax TaxID=35708 RepID=A0A0A9FKT7_ARUDO